MSATAPPVVAVQPPTHISSQPNGVQESSDMDAAAHSATRRKQPACLRRSLTNRTSCIALSPYPPPQPGNAQTYPGQPNAQGVQQQQMLQQQQQPSSNGPATSLMQLRQEVPPAPVVRAPRKRKSPPDTSVDKSQQQGPPPPQPQPQQLAQVNHAVPPPGSYPPHPHSIPMAQYPYPPPGDYASAGMPPPHMIPPHPGAMPQSSMQQAQQQMQNPDGSMRPSRQLSTSKRAEQNRKAQRAFRERRDQSVSCTAFKATRARALIVDGMILMVVFYADM